MPIPHHAEILETSNNIDPTFGGDVLIYAARIEAGGISPVLLSALVIKLFGVASNCLLKLEEVQGKLVQMAEEDKIKESLDKAGVRL